MAAINGGYFVMDPAAGAPSQLRRHRRHPDKPAAARRHLHRRTRDRGLTHEFGASTPSGPGLETVLDAHGTVTAVNTTLGTAVPAGGHTLQAIGSGWVHKRNPGTIAGVDAQGRTVLVTADGRQTTSLGLSLKETSDMARSLGMVNAINLDGGGSTTMVEGGQVVNSPSDESGERQVGDALLILAGRKG
ncbi:MAG TPA: phosphodiester glycosidase family protein [Arthrobacter sp.]